MEKPTKVATGQRYRTFRCGVDITIDRPIDGGWVSECGSRFTDEYLLDRCTYLGGPTPPVSPVGTVKSINPDGTFEIQFGASGQVASVVPAELTGDVRRWSCAKCRDMFSTPREALDCTHGAPPTAPSVSTPVLSICAWRTQRKAGGQTYECENTVAHTTSPYCETHIFEAMKQRDTKKREARKELSGFHVPGSAPPQQTAYRTRSLREEER